MALLNHFLFGALGSLLGLTGLNALLVLYTLWRHRLTCARAALLVELGERRGRTHALDEVRMLSHGQLKAHIIALQQCLVAAEMAPFGERLSWIMKAQAQTQMLLKQVVRLYEGVSDTVFPTDFETALRELSTSLSAAYPACVCRVEVLGRPSVPLSDELQRAMIVVLSNALQNAYTHGRPSSVLVQLQYAPDAVILIITDNGSGLSAPTEVSKGRGLSDMRRVVAQQGGGLTIESAPDFGTRVTATVPVSVTQQDAQGEPDVSFDLVPTHAS